MDNGDYFLLIICFCVLPFLVIFFIRNFAVYRLRQHVNRLEFKYNMKHIGADWVNAYSQLPEYNEMLYSFKRLKMENYLDKETIQKLTS